MNLWLGTLPIFLVAATLAILLVKRWRKSALKIFTTLNIVMMAGALALLAGALSAAPAAATGSVAAAAATPAGAGGAALIAAAIAVAGSSIGAAFAVAYIISIILIGKA